MPPRTHVICTLPGCSNPHYATGLCRPHYIQRRNAIARAATQPINGAIRTTSKPAHISIHGAPLPPPALPTWIAPVPVLVPPPPPPQRAVDLPPVFNDKGQPGFPVRDSSRPPGWKPAPVPAAPACVSVPPAPMLPSVPVPPVVK
jgi:hypothetical protein